MNDKTQRQLKVLFNMLNTCVSQDIISLELSVSIKRDASTNNQYISYYTDIYTKLWAFHND
jgi:hypothetical protein